MTTFQCKGCCQNHDPCYFRNKRARSQGWIKSHLEPAVHLCPSSSALHSPFSGRRQAPSTHLEIPPSRSMDRRARNHGQESTGRREPNQFFDCRWWRARMGRLVWIQWQGWKNNNSFIGFPCRHFFEHANTVTKEWKSWTENKVPLLFLVHFFGLTQTLVGTRQWYYRLNSRTRYQNHPRSMPPALWASIPPVVSWLRQTEDTKRTLRYGLPLPALAKPARQKIGERIKFASPSPRKWHWPFQWRSTRSKAGKRMPNFKRWWLMQNLSFFIGRYFEWQLRWIVTGLEMSIIFSWSLIRWRRLDYTFARDHVDACWSDI